MISIQLHFVIGQSMTARVASFETDARIIPNIICMPILVRNSQ